MVIVKQRNSCLKNLRNVSLDIQDYIDINKGATLYVSILTKKPKLIISKGFFYYMNGEVITEKSLYKYYSKLIERLKDLKITVICEYDKLDPKNLNNMNLKIVDAFNESFSLSYKHLHTILLQLPMSFTYVKIGAHFIVGCGFPEKGFPGIFRYHIENEKAVSFIIRTDNTKDDITTKTMDSLLYKPISKFENGKIKTTFMLNEKPIV